MGLFKRLGFSRNSTNISEATTQNDCQPPRKRSVISLVPLSEVTEASLKVFRQLPAGIRHDPSMISFQQEHERWKGKKIYILNCLKCTNPSILTIQKNSLPIIAPRAAAY